MHLDRPTLLRMYRALTGTRQAEQAITELSHRGVLPGHHSGLNHEAIGVGVGFALRADDCAQTSHRSGMMLAHARGGFSLGEAIRSKFGLAPDCHAAVPGRARTLPIVGLVGTWVPMSVGVAMADRLRARDAVTVTFFGDGAANEGAVHEAMNLAGARRLPMVFFVENNGMAVSMSAAESTAARELASRGVGYGMPGVRIDGHDPVEIHRVTTEALLRGMRGEGPSLIEVVVQRWEGHAVGLRDTRTVEQLQQARSRDALREFRERLLREQVLEVAAADAMDSECRIEVEQAIDECLREPRAEGVPASIGPAEARRLTFAP